MDISDSVFNLLLDFVRKKAGIFLPVSKKLFVISKIKERARELGFDSVEDYIRYAVKKDNLRENFKLISLLTVGKTDFFREYEHYKLLYSKILPYFFSKRKLLRIWSIGCSSGEEPYSISILIEEYINNSINKDIDYYILATDINLKSIEKAREGIYSVSDLENVPLDILKKYFLFEGKTSEEFYRVREKIKRKINFKVDNIIDSKVYDLFDIIFLKNVMMYFSVDDRQRVIDKVYDSLEYDGFLFIGLSESIDDLKYKLKRFFVKVYQKFIWGLLWMSWLF